jgi:chemotaxis protein MotA
MILMLSSINDVDQVPARMAIALTSAFFGLGAGYLFFMPMAGKLRRRSEEEMATNEIIIRGVLLIQSGVNPRVIEGCLKAYLEPAQRKYINPEKGK